jgi:HNH endonuclease
MLPGSKKSLPAGRRTCLWCRADGLLHVPCITCGKPFAAYSRAAKYCGGDCAPARIPPPRTPRIRKPRIAATCAEPGCEKAACKRGFCDSHYQKRCRPDRSHGAVDRFKTWNQQNAEKYAKHLEDKNHRRRAKMRDAPTERIDRQIVGDRDGWRCFCGKRVDQALKHPHPMSQSLDHIVPVSEHGGHTYANVRIAHLQCNTERGSRGGGEQLALFGRWEVA